MDNRPFHASGQFPAASSNLEAFPAFPAQAHRQTDSAAETPHHAPADLDVEMGDSADPFAPDADCDDGASEVTNTPSRAMSPSLPTDEPKGRKSVPHWTDEEDKTLMLMKMAGRHREEISKAIPGRSGKACDKRYHRILDKTGEKDDTTDAAAGPATADPVPARLIIPQVDSASFVSPFALKDIEEYRRTRWTPEEDRVLNICHNQGMPFYKMMFQLPGRTAQACSARIGLLARKGHLRPAGFENDRPAVVKEDGDEEEEAEEKEVEEDDKMDVDGGCEHVPTSPTKPTGEDTEITPTGGDTETTSTGERTVFTPDPKTDPFRPPWDDEYYVSSTWFSDRDEVIRRYKITDKELADLLEMAGPEQIIDNLALARIIWTFRLDTSNLPSPNPCIGYPGSALDYTINPDAVNPDEPRGNE